MGYWKNGLVSLAASAAFLVIDITVLSLAPAYRWVGAFAVFISVALLLWLFHSRRPRNASEKGKILSSNEYGGNADISVEGSKIRTRKEADILSMNKVGGATKISIKDSEL